MSDVTDGESEPCCPCEARRYASFTGEGTDYICRDGQEKRRNGRMMEKEDKEQEGENTTN